MGKKQETPKDEFIRVLKKRIENKIAALNRVSDAAEDDELESVILGKVAELYEVLAEIDHINGE